MLTLMQANQELVSIVNMCQGAAWVFTVLSSRYPNGMTIDTGVVFYGKPVLLHVEFNHHNTMAIINAVHMEKVVNWDTIGYTFPTAMTEAITNEVQEKTRTQRTVSKDRGTRRVYGGQWLNSCIGEPLFIDEGLYEIDLNNFKFLDTIAKPDVLLNKDKQNE